MCLTNYMHFDILMRGDRDSLTQETSWHCIPFIYLDERNNGKVISKYFFYNIGFP